MQRICEKDHDAGQPCSAIRPSIELVSGNLRRMHDDSLATRLAQVERLYDLVSEWVYEFTLSVRTPCRLCLRCAVNQHRTLRRSWMFCCSPAGFLVSSSPLLLGVSKPPLDFFDSGFVAGVLADIVANLDSMSSLCGGNLDDDVQRYRLVASRFLDIVICES